MVFSIAQIVPITRSVLAWESWWSTFLVTFVVSFVCGYTCGMIAQKGDMRSSLYVWFGVLLGPIGILITVIVYFTSRDKPKPMELPKAPTYSPFESPIGYDDPYFNQLYAPNQPPPEEFAQGSIMCPNCNVSVPVDYSVCWNCGELLKRQSISRLCPTCHQEIPEGAESCDKCGSSLNGSAYPK